ncbi:hypothetical protein OPT61_g4344 [Boeremia exigua]|uniref:Uncharacterized protein n=1 Tax=Boeremia exigua TaxID=749465 RepID=A0ACC2IEH1_9PLEO|nr:hypothetical protein OPT61_g4344 [Boeremia exigua]
MPTRPKNYINPQTRHHNQQPVHRQPQRGIPQQPPPPIAIIVALATRAALDSGRKLNLVILVLDQALVVRRVRVRDLVIEEAGQDEGDGGGAGAADVREHEGQRGDGHGGDEGEHDEDGGDDGEAHVAHFGAGFGGRVADERAPGAGVEAGAAWVDLEWVGEHDEDDDGEAADGCGGGGRVHGHDVAFDVVAVTEVAGDAGEDVQGAGAADGGKDDGRRAEVRVIGDLVEDREHVLVARVREDDDREGGKCADRAGPFKDAHCAARGERVALDVVGNDEDDQVGDGEEGDDGGVLERVEAAEEGQRDYNEPGRVSCRRVHGRTWGDTHIKAVIQNWRSTRKATSAAPGAKPTTTPGIRSPMMIR